MGAYDRHHFVPQFYLRRFALDEKQRRIGMYIISSDEFVSSSSIRDQAQQFKLYGSDQTEKVLSELEGDVSVIIGRMIEWLEVPKFHSKEHFGLILYILIQHHRTPTAGDELKESTELMVKKIAECDPTLAPHANFIGVEWPDVTRESLRLAVLSHHLMMDLRYKLLVNRTGVPFITSDHPVVFYNQFAERKRKPGSATGTASKGLQVIFPLSPACCLLLYDYAVYKVGGRSTSSVQIPATADDVSALNLLQVMNAGNHLFFSSAVSEQCVRRIASSAVPLRRVTRSSVKDYHSVPKQNGSSSTLLHSSKTDIRIGLKLSAVSELRSVRGYSFAGSLVHQRDPILVGLHKQFLQGVEEGKYQAAEFGRFLNDEEQRELSKLRAWGAQSIK
jgi:hypothetical protein